VDPDFNLEAWQADAGGKARSDGSRCAVVDVVAAVRDGYSTTKALIERLISKAVDVRGIKALTRGKYIIGPKAEGLLEAESYK
jgi:hypothetical protein